MKEERFYIGRILKNARTAKGITLEEASKDTRITKLYLQSIEDEQLSKVPGDTVLRGFLKIYSDYLGVDPRPIFAELSKRQQKEKNIELVVDVKKTEKKEIDLEKIKPALKATCPAVIALLAAVLLFAALSMFAGYIYKAAADYKNTQSKIGLNKDKRLEINAEIIGSTWVSVNSDGREIFSGMLRKGAKKTWRANGRIYMKIGNAAGIRIMSGKKVVFQPGNEGDVVTKEFIK